MHLRFDDMANYFGAAKRFTRIASEAAATGSTDIETFLIVWALTVVACVCVGVGVAKALEPMTDAEINAVGLWRHHCGGNDTGDHGNIDGVGT